METEKRIPFLEYIPVSTFGAVMGLCGLGFAWKLAGRFWGLSPLVGEFISYLAVLLFVILSVVFLFKLKRYPEILHKEFSNPVSVSFFGTIIISLLLIPGIILPVLPSVAIVMWMVAAVGMFIFALFVLRVWFDHKQMPDSAMPAWIIPVVGTLDVPIVGSHLPMPWVHEVCVAFFGIGFIFAVILLTIIISRLIFQNPLPDGLQPTLMILAGPFALTFTDYQSLTGNVSMAASMLFYFNIFLLLLVGGKVMSIPKLCPFYLSWWSISFPLAAATISAIHYAEHKPGIVQQIIAAVLLAVTTLVATSLFTQSVYHIVTGTFAALAPKPTPISTAEALESGELV